MEEYFYIPVEKDGDEFIQREVLDNDERFEYHIENYKKVIDKYFDEIDAVVALKTGKFFTKIYQPKDDTVDIYFCLVNQNNFPDEQNEIIINEDAINEIKQNLSLKVKYSEGIYNDQIIDIFSNFVTPRIKFSHSEKDVFYSHKIFYKNCLIFGAPGSGKTTLLRRLTLDYLSNSFESDNKLNKLPVYIQLRDFNNYSSDFDTYIDNCIKNSFTNIDFYAKNKLSNTGNLCLMLDGADEIDFEKFQSFKNTIINYKNKKPLVSFIITSRPDRDYESIKDFDKCYVQPFSRSQIKELTYRKLGKTEKWKYYISILNSVPEVYEVLKNPLLLTISHFLFLHKSILPINSGQLIKELVAALANNWDSQRNIERKLENKKVSPIEITNTLGKIALALSEKKTINIKAEEILRLFDNFESVSEVKKYLEYIEFATGLLKRDNSNLWSFSHKSIQDYLCSNFLVESVGELNKNIFIDKDWDKILLMISGLSSDPNYVINSILNQPNRKEIDKLKNSLSCFYESHLLTRNDIKHSYELLENYVLSFEKENKINSRKIVVSQDNVLIKLSNETKGFKEIVSLISVLLKTRFTKYEYDFFGYLTNSKSKLLKSISNLTLAKGNISVISANNNTEFKHDAESPEIKE